MFIRKARLDDLNYLAKNLHQNCIEEIQLLFKEKWEDRFLKSFSKLNSKVVISKKTNKPIAIFSLSVLGDKTAGINFLMADGIEKENTFALIKKSDEQIKEWMKDYNTLFQWCYEKNIKVKKWLKYLGFKFLQYGNDDFSIYYKGIINDN